MPGWWLVKLFWGETGEPHGGFGVFCWGFGRFRQEGLWKTSLGSWVVHLPLLVLSLLISLIGLFNQRIHGIHLLQSWNTEKAV